VKGWSFVFCCAKEKEGLAQLGRAASAGAEWRLEGAVGTYAREAMRSLRSSFLSLRLT